MASRRFFNWWFRILISGRLFGKFSINRLRAKLRDNFIPDFFKKCLQAVPGDDPSTFS
jgi:hypothetical protein